MARVLTNNKNYYDIADTIRQMKDVDTTYKPREMASALKDIYSNEVDGTLPLTFKSNGMNLLNYRIDGASGGVGDLITDSLDEKFGKYKVPVVVSGKNLFNENSEWNLIGSFTSGTQQFPQSIEGNRRTYFFKVRPNTFYTVSTETVGDRLGINEYSREINPVNATTNNKIAPDRIIYKATDSFTNPYTFQTSSTAKIVGIYYSLNTIPTNIQIEIGNIATDYEPYHEPTTTNIYLDEPIEAKANIPSEYTEVEYIENTGTQYIDTGIIPSDNWKYEIIYKDNAAQGSNYVMGSRQTANSSIFAGVGGGQSTQSISIHNSSCTTPSNYRTANYTYKINAEYNSSGTGTSQIICLTNNEKFTGTQTANINATANYYIFALNASQIHEGMSLYKLKLWNNNVLVRDFIPCYRKSDNVAGLYDLVNSTFYTNQGTGNFIVGSIKENESISLSDTGIDIPTIDGTNTLTINTTVQPSNVYIQARKNPDFIALDMSNIKLATSTFTTLPSLIANADWSNVTDAAGMFNLCSNLTTVPELDLSSATNLAQMFRYCIALTNLGGFKNLGQAYLTSESSNYSEYKLDLSSCTQLTHDSLMNVINKLYDIATKGCNTQQLVLGSTNLAKLTAEEIAIATNKGWSVS